MKKEKLGLYGGTFSPPHLGHVRALRVFLETVRPDRTLIMPCAIPPNKQKLSVDTPEERYEMCRAAFGGLEGVEVSDYEIKKGDVSYTVDTLNHLRRRGREIDLLCGSDVFLTLEQWRRFEEVFRRAVICCVSRHGDDYDLLESAAERYRKAYRAKTMIIRAGVLDVSSTEVRQRIAQELPLSGYLPDSVTEIIRRDNLYREEI